MQPKTYRYWIKDRGLVSFSVAVKETDLFIRAESNLKKKALEATQKNRVLLESYIQEHPLFATSLVPLAVEEDAPLVVREMASAAKEAGVGPMAAVAGAIAQCIGRELLSLSHQVIVENGGDIFLKVSRKQLIGVYAGESILTRGIAFEIQPEETPLGICTSSGTVGHSISFGQADAVIAFSSSAALADAAATAIANRVKAIGDIPQVLEFAQSIAGLRGVAIIKDDSLGLWGQIKIAQANGQ